MTENGWTDTRIENTQTDYEKRYEETESRTHGQSDTHRHMKIKGSHKQTSLHTKKASNFQDTKVEKHLLESRERETVRHQDRHTHRQSDRLPDWQPDTHTV